MAKFISSKVLIGRVYRDYKPKHSNWVNDAYEWVGECLALIGVYNIFFYEPIKVQILNYKALLPCSVDLIEGVSVGCYRLKYSGSTAVKHGISCVKNYPYHYDAEYVINGNYIQTNFETGEVTIFTAKLPVDCDGFPEIPDDAHVKQALAWYVLYKMVMGGYNYNLLSFKELDFKVNNVLIPRAQNSLNAPSTDQFELIKSRWLAVIPDFNAANKFFADDKNSMYISDHIVGAITDPFSNPAAP